MMRTYIMTDIFGCFAFDSGKSSIFAAGENTKPMTKELSLLHMRKQAIELENEWYRKVIPNIEDRYAQIIEYLIATNNTQYNDILERIIEEERGIE